MIDTFVQVLNAVGGANDQKLITILKAVLGTLTALGVIISAIGAIRAGISLSQATSEEDGARHKKRLINCIVAVVVCGVALTVSEVVLHVAEGWLKN